MDLNRLLKNIAVRGTTREKNKQNRVAVLGFPTAPTEPATGFVQDAVIADVHKKYSHIHFKLSMDEDDKNEF